MSVYKEPVVWITKSINSILHQTYDDFEFIIVCDNPDGDTTKECLNYFANSDKRIKIIWNDVNIGLTKSLNKALAVANGEYIARMDADDIADIHRFEKQIEILKRGEKFVYSGIDYINENGNKIKGISVSDKFSESDFFIFNCIAHPTVIFESSLLKLRHPFYNESFKRSQDYELWAFLFLNDVHLTKIKETLLHYRISQSQITNKNRSEQKSDFETIRINLIFNYLQKKGYQIDCSKTDSNLLFSIYNQLVENKQLIFEDGAIRSIYYLVCYTLIPTNKSLLWNFLNITAIKNYGIRRIVYVLLRAFRLKLIPFYLIKSEFV